MTPRLSLDRITLRNFKGIRDLTVEPNGGDLTIYGQNATGKTTVADAFYWLLFDKDSAGRKDFDIKTLDRDSGLAFQSLDHTVEAALALPDGERVVLSKTYREKHERKRGSATAEFTGHTTDYSVNGVPLKEREYAERVRAICDESRFRLLTDPHAFNGQLKWQDRRKTLLEVCGDVTDADVIASSPALAELPAILGKATLDDYRKVIDARKKAINEELRTLPARIDEADRSMPADPGEAAVDASLPDKIKALNEERATVTAGGTVAVKTKKLRELEAEGQQIQNRLNEDGRKAVDEAHTLRQAKLHAADDADRKVVQIEGFIADQEAKRSRHEKRREELRAEWNLENAKEFKDGSPDSCAACGQPLPADKVAEARAKALEEFNLSKANRLKVITEEGEAAKSASEECDRQIAKSKENLERDRAEAKRIREEAEAVVVPAATVVDASKDPEFVKNTEARKALASEIADLQQSGTSELSRIDAEIQELHQLVDAAARAQAAREQRETTARRIEELKAREKSLNEEFERLAQELFLTEEFVRTKVSMLTERINAKFGMARFKLFDVLVNGGLEECCEATYMGVPFASLNHGAQINVGLDVVNALARHYQFAPPVFVDNAESVTSIIPTEGQQIRLVVSAADKSLRVEAAQPSEEKVTA